MMIQNGDLFTFLKYIEKITNKTKQKCYASHKLNPVNPKKQPTILPLAHNNVSGNKSEWAMSPPPNPAA